MARREVERVVNFFRPWSGDATCLMRLFLIRCTHYPLSFGKRQSMGNSAFSEEFDVAVSMCDLGMLNRSISEEKYIGSTVHKRLNDLLLSGKQAQIEQCLAALPANHILSGLFLYSAGLGRAMNLDMAAAEFLWKGAWISSLIPAFEADTIFQSNVWPTMMFQASFCEPQEYTDGATTPAWPGIRYGRISQEWPTHGIITVTSCSPDYFLSYSDRFMASFRKSCAKSPVLIHIINPTVEARTQAIAMTAADPALLVTSEIGPDLAAYLASNRLLIAARLIKRFGCPLLVTDIDTEFPPGFDQVLDLLPNHELVLARNPEKLYPSMQISAAFVYLGANPHTFRFLQVLEAYLAKKLNEAPIWMVDQAALFHASCLMKVESFLVPESRSITLPAGLRIPDSLVTTHVLSEQVRKTKRKLGDCTLDFENLSHRPILRYEARLIL